MSWDRNYVKIKDLGTVITGKTPPGADKNHFGFEAPFVTPTDFNAYNKNVFNAQRRLSKSGIISVGNRLLPINSVLVSCIGSDMGKVVMNKVPCITNQQINSIIPDKEKVDSDFLYYSVVRLYDQLRNMATGGSTMPIVNKTDFENIEIVLPPLPTQRRIASILSALDDKIELNRRMNETLEGMAQAIWEEWFGRDNTNEEELILLGDLIEFNPKVQISAGEQVTYVEMKDLPEKGMCVLGSIKRSYSAGSKFQLNDTLLARITPCLENGKTAFVNFLKEGEKAFGSTEFITMRAKSTVTPYYVYFVARNERFRQFSIGSMVGSSGRQRVQTEILPTFEVQKPSSQKLADFHLFAKLIFEQIFLNATQSRTLSALRDTLLPRLMRGEIDV